MSYTIVVTTDEYNAECYGNFGTRDRAQIEADRLDEKTNAERDFAEERIRFQVCQIQPLRRFE